MRKQTFVADIWGILSPILIYYVASVSLQMILTAFFPMLLTEENSMWLLTFVNICMLPVFIWMYWGDRLWREEENRRRPRSGMGALLWILAGAVCISRGVNLLIGLTPLPYLFPGYEAVSESIYAGSLVSRIAASVISAPILEELLIRGILYSRLKLATGSIRLSMVVSAFVFGLFHGNVVQGVYAFLLGLFFAQIYETYPGLWPAILAHMAANATSIFLEEFIWPNEIIQDPAVYYLQTVMFLLLGWLCRKKICQAV